MRFTHQHTIKEKIWVCEIVFYEIIKQIIINRETDRQVNNINKGKNV